MNEQLKPWWQIAQPHKDIREGRFDPAVFAADLGMVLAGEGAVDYRDPVTFFKKTYLTRGLRQLLLDVLGRLAGKGIGEAVIQLQTPFGGGKTHTLIALYHLVKHGSEVRHLEPIEGLLAEGGLDEIPKARLATLVGTALSATEGRRTPEGLHIRTLWGEMAYQLGGSDLYQLVEASDQARVAPGTDVLSQLLTQATPCLILMDEVMRYLSKAKGVPVVDSTLASQTLDFCYELTVATANVPQATLVATLPMSPVELSAAEDEWMLHRLERVFGRIERVRTPVEGAEIYEILRRRLFEDVGDVPQRRRVAEAYWELYQRLAPDLPRKVREPEYRRRLERAFPFHPELVEILYERWGSLPKFQRTRGVLRLLALVVGDLYRKGHKGAFIQPSHVDLGEPNIRREFVKLVGDAYDTVIASDIADHGAKAFQIDRELGSEYAREQIAQGLATSIFLYSHSGGRERGGTEPQLRLAVLHPDMTPAIVADAMDRLAKRLWYLYSDGGVWRFSTQPNLNKILVEREDAVQSEDIREEVRRTLGEIIGLRTFRRVYIWPEEDRDVADTSELSLVVLDMDHPMGQEDENETRRFISHILNNHGMTYRKYRNTLVFLAPDDAVLQGVVEAARRLIALRGIAMDYATGEQLSEEQRQDLEKRLDDARSRLPSLVSAAYRHIVVGGPEKELHAWDMGAQAYDTSRTLSQRVWDTLKSEEKLLEKLDPRLIVEERWTLWPGDKDVLRVADLWDYFVRYTHLPMLADQAVLTKAIVEGLERGLFGYGLGDGERLDFDTFYPPGTPPEGQLREAPQSAWLVRPEVAARIAPPQLPGPTPPGPPPPGLPPPTPPPPVPPPVIAPGAERRYRRVVIRTPVNWENWQDFYNEVIDPLIREGADLSIRIEVSAQSDTGIRENTVELGIRESLFQRGVAPEIEVE